MSGPPKPGVYVPDGLQSENVETARKTLFLDRDGVININHGYVHTVERTDWVPGIFELCGAAKNAGYTLVVVTNQAGIARGYYSEAEFLTYTKWMHEEFEIRGMSIFATLYCPHHPTDGSDELRVQCACRKPAPGLFTTAIDLFGLDAERSLMVGDKRSDLIAAAAAGVHRGFLIDSERSDPYGEVIGYINLHSHA